MWSRGLATPCRRKRLARRRSAAHRWTIRCPRPARAHPLAARRLPLLRRCRDPGRREGLGCPLPSRVAKRRTGAFNAAGRHTHRVERRRPARIPAARLPASRHRRCPRPRRRLRHARRAAHRGAPRCHRGALLPAALRRRPGRASVAGRHRGSGHPAALERAAISFLGHHRNGARENTQLAEHVCTKTAQPVGAQPAQHLLHE